MVMLDPMLARLVLAAAIVLTLVGIVAAWTSANVVKRVAGLLVAMLGALVGAVALGAPSSVLMIGAAIAFAQMAVGAVLIVRLQEGYGAVEAADLDSADGADEPPEPKA